MQGHKDPEHSLSLWGNTSLLVSSSEQMGLFWIQTSDAEAHKVSRFLNLTVSYIASAHSATCFDFGSIVWLAVPAKFRVCHCIRQ